MIKPYKDLTLHGQSRRLRVMAIQALKHYDINVARLSLITNDFNAIYRVDSTSGEKFILRVTLPEGGHNKETIEAEVTWLDALSKETNLSVPQPFPSRNGQYALEISTEGVPEPRWCAIFRWMPGVNLADHLNAENVTKLGSLMAHLHNHAAKFKPDNTHQVPHFDRVFPFPEPVILFDEAYKDIFPASRKEILLQAIAWAEHAIKILIESGEPMRIIHADLHQWNVRIFHEKLSPIDFEDLMWGWPVQDIGTTLFYFLNETYEEMYQAFKVGYSSVSPWPERYPGEIESFIAARSVGLVNFILNDPNPNWRNQIPEFIKKNEIRLQKLLEKRFLD